MPEMSVSKWRVFICPYKRVSVIHRFPKKPEPRCGERPADFSPLRNQRSTNHLSPLPWAGSLTTVSWDNENRNLTRSSIPLMLIEYYSPQEQKDKKGK